ncbi:HD-GYP domain-containing protein [Ideonella sp. A 288]|uniref:HD-GYP domain-containing protein n=1 Tax=Ideonella sp. A 288 TaxID=1962181 RepID=UPI000B4AF248|nr:HD-GYP domain-containing protein [Ideonella sp. A 288]
MSATIEIEQLRVGMFIHLDLGWWAHPFALSSFQIASPDQIATLRALGLKQLRWSPEKSHLDDADAPAVDPAGASAAPAAQADAGADAGAADGAAAIHLQRHALAAQRAADATCDRQYAEAGRAWKEATELVHASPDQARHTVEGLTRALLDKMLVDGEMCIRVLSEGLGDRAGAHALNVTVISLLMGRVFGLGPDEMLDMGVGALLHDVGKLELPDRVRHVDTHFTQAEHTLYREHVAHGVMHGKRMGLSRGALVVLAQHHEMTDGSGFPQRLNIDRMAASARIVSLVNRYDNLCNPLSPALALTPHEALSLIFAQAKSKFDASMLNAFIRMMGVYPPGSLVQLTDDRYATVVSVNSSRPLKPRVLVCDPKVPVEQALLLNLEEASDIGVRRSLKATQLPPAAHSYLAPRPRVVYFFEPSLATVGEARAEMAA